MMAHSQESFSSTSPLQMSLPFSRGQAFIVSVLDSLLSLVINGDRDVSTSPNRYRNRYEKNRYEKLLKTAKHRKIALKIATITYKKSYLFSHGIHILNKIA